MTANIDLSEGAAELIVEQHRLACQQIDQTAGAVPTSFDGGMADPYVGQILSEIVQTAGEIAGINLGISMLVAEVANNLQATDEQIGDALREAARGLE